MIGLLVLAIVVWNFYIGYRRPPLYAKLITWFQSHTCVAAYFYQRR